VLDKNKLDKELARRLSAAFISNQMGVGITTQYKKTPEDVGDLWYFLAALADKLARESQEGVYRDWGRLATEIIHSEFINPPSIRPVRDSYGSRWTCESFALPLYRSCAHAKHHRTPYLPGKAGRMRARIG